MLHYNEKTVEARQRPGQERKDTQFHILSTSPGVMLSGKLPKSVPIVNPFYCIAVHNDGLYGYRIRGGPFLQTLGSHAKQEQI